MDIHAKSVDMDMDMDGKFHIHGNPDDTVQASIMKTRKKLFLSFPLQSLVPIHPVTYYFSFAFSLPSSAFPFSIL